MSDLRFAALLEVEPELNGRVERYFKGEGYTVSSFDAADPLLAFLNDNPISLAVIGRSEEPPLDLLKLIVRQSPMTSVIMLTDLSDTELHEMAEGYGILGAAPRSKPEGALKELKDRFEEIMGILAPQNLT